MTVKEANENFIKFTTQHLLMVQQGKFGTPTLQDLNFCGKLHILIEEGLINKLPETTNGEPNFMEVCKCNVSLIKSCLHEKCPNK